ncbi:MAG: site-2 protease family protein [Anaerolineae bacterium]|nr:site-2 protease family protein [Anaerolineae bacterium]
MIWQNGQRLAALCRTEHAGERAVLYNLTPEILLGRVIGLVIGFTLHEWAHAFTAYRLGDNTAYRQGRLTLDPRAHIEPLGIILALIAGFGWARPVPINPRAFYPHETRGLVIVSLAGPVMNLIIAAVFGSAIRLLSAAGMMPGFLYTVLATVVLFNIVLFLFNLIPLAPLDGYRIAVGVLPYQQSAALVRYERETTLALMLIIMLGAITNGRLDPLGTLLGPPIRFLFRTLV